MARSRVLFIAGNWKMFKWPSETGDFCTYLSAPPGVDVVICPPYTSLAMAVASGVTVYAQNVHWAEEGAFTGEVSAAMIKDAGATYVNDVTAFRHDPDLAGLVADRGVDCCLMHMLGEPRTMQDDPRYEDVVDDVRAFLEERAEFAVGEGVREERIMVDPGIGFGKTLDHNLELLRRLDEIVAGGFPVVVGTSRKSFLGRLTGREDPHDRVAATVATTVLALERGAAVFRVHDVAPTKDALTVATATLRADGA